MSEASELVARESSSKIPAATSSPTPSSGEAPRSGTKKLGSSKFDLIAELGRGGMATVYLARAKRRPEKLLVLKQLRADLADNPEFLAMFLEEARLAGRLQHPNIVETYEVGEDAGTYYIAMEYLEGLSLQAVLTKFGWKGNFTFAMQVYVLIEVLKGLEHAYNQLDDEGKPLRIVHRDVSPPNIIITFDGKVKLVDFGIAKAANSNVETRTGLIKGKLTYMAPEQAQSGDVDARTDIYSVGVMLWQAAAGKRRWKGVENTEVLQRLHAGKVSDSPNATLNGLPSLVDDIVLKAIRADVEERYASTAEFRIALERLLEQLGPRVSSKHLRDFMSEQFRGERERAGEVLRLRMQELYGSPSSNTRADYARHSSRAPEREPFSATKPDNARRLDSKPQSSQEIATNLEGKRGISIEETRSSSDVSETKPSAFPQKNRILPIASIGLAAITVLIFLAVRTHRPAQISAAASLPPSADNLVTSKSSIRPTSSSVETSLVGSVPSSSVAAMATPLQTPSGHERNTVHGATPPNKPTHAQTTAGPSVLSALPAPQQQPSAAIPPSSTEPPVVKEDPWKESGSNVDKSDPWSTSQSPSVPRSDPWAK